MIKQKTLARRLNVKSSQLSRVLSGERHFSRHSARYINEEFGLPFKVLCFENGLIIKELLEGEFGKINCKVGRPAK